MMPQAPATTPLLEVRGVVKRFPGVLALRGVNLAVGPGEVVALVGENGAGKSTLMKILAGVQPPDEGRILLDGRPVAIESVQRAMQLGIALIHQELNLADNLDVGANIFLGREPRRLGLIDKGRVRAESGKVLESLGLDVSPDAIVGTLTIGRQQMVEIAKAISINARVLIMDEPTSSLSAHETERLFAVIRDLRSRGVAIIYISHRLGEVMELADRVVVLRDGENAGTLPKEEIERDRMVRMMVGRDINQFYDRKPRAPGEVVFEVQRIVAPDHPRHAISFSLRAGEIVGMAGLVGAGRSELLDVLFGVERPLSGELRVAGKRIATRSPRDTIRAGVALVPEDRKQQGLVLEVSVRENIGLPGLWFQRRLGGFINHAAESRHAREMIDAMHIKTPSPRQIAQFLSGGNQQKIVIGKWLALNPKVLLLDEPTRGVDVGAKQEIYHLMERLAEQGVAILFVSSDLEEVLHMSDRVLVMHEGRLAGELPREALTEEAVMSLATGGDLVVN